MRAAPPTPNASSCGSQATFAINSACRRAPARQPPRSRWLPFLARLLSVPAPPCPTACLVSLYRFVIGVPLWPPRPPRHHACCVPWPLLCVCRSVLPVQMSMAVGCSRTAATATRRRRAAWVTAWTCVLAPARPGMWAPTLRSLMRSPSEGAPVGWPPQCSAQSVHRAWSRCYPLVWAPQPWKAFLLLRVDVALTSCAPLLPRRMPVHVAAAQPQPLTAPAARPLDSPLPLADFHSSQDRCLSRHCPAPPLAGYLCIVPWLEFCSGLRLLGSHALWAFCVLVVCASCANFCLSPRPASYYSAYASHGRHRLAG